MKNHKIKSFLYSLSFHGGLAGVILLLTIYSSEVKKVTAEKRHVVKLSQVAIAKPAPKQVEKVVKKPTPPKKKRKPPQKVKKKVKKVVKKTIKKRPPPKKIVPVKKAPPVVKEKIIEPEIVEERVQEEPKEIVVTPTEPVTLTPAIVKKITAPAVTAEDAYVQKHIAEIMVLLRENLYYPRMARKRHMEGKVVVSFTLLTNGKIIDIKIVEAKKKLLGKAAVTTIERLRGKFPLPDETLYLHVPIMYRLK